MIERRRNPRYLCSHIVEVAQHECACAALLEDVSREGVGVAVEAAVETGTKVELSAPGFKTEAQVRYCNRRETDFRIGLEFRDGTRWHPEEWRPDHLFLPPLI